MMRQLFSILGLSFLSLFASASGGFGKEVLAANEYANLANHIATSLQCARLIIARNQDVINTHGAKVGEPSLDVAGYPMEGYKEGEIRGGISVTIPVKERQAFLINSSYFLDLEKSQRP